MSHINPNDAANKAQVLQSSSPDAELACILDDAVAAFHRHVVVSREAEIACALWSAHTHTYQRFDYSPRLAVSAPEEGCGKSVMCEVVNLLSCESTWVENVTSSAVFRSIEGARGRPLTLILDEYDTYLVGNQELRGIINSGFAKDGKVLRNKQDTKSGDWIPTPFPTYCPLALAGIGDLPTTIRSRSIIIGLKKRLASEKIEKLRKGQNRQILESIRKRLNQWFLLHGDSLNLDPPVPEGLGDRHEDISVALVAIADAAGAAWGDQARKALVAIFREGKAAGNQDEEKPGLALLSDIRSIFMQCGEDRLASNTICTRLASLEGRPWGEWKGKPLTQFQLASMLKGYRIYPQKIRIKEETLGGYKLEWFKDAWERYLDTYKPSCSDPEA